MAMVPGAAPPQAPIGIFDSGVGGLSVLRAVRRLAPDEPLLYLADHAHAPYGEQAPLAIEQRTLRLGQWLVDQGCRAVVVACNTATAVAVEALRRAVAVPVVAIEPAVKPAAEWTQSGVIGVLATTATVGSERLKRLCHDHAETRGVRVVLQAGTGLVERVEAGDLNGPLTQALLARLLAPMRAAGADVLVLGCTHYPFLADALRHELGDAVRLVDPADAVARELMRRLGRVEALEPLERPSPEAHGDGGGGGPAALAVPALAPVRLVTTGDLQTVGEVVKRLWPEAPGVEALRGV